MKMAATISISQFKTHALRLVDEVSRTGRSLRITKRGKPVAELVPVREAVETHLPGRLRHTVAYLGDIVSPLGPDDWSAAK
jgi:prevent-host-death family protein